MMKLKYKNNDVLLIILFFVLGTLVFSDIAYAKDGAIIQSNFSHFSIAQLAEAGLPDMAQSMTKSNNFYVEENGNKLKFTGVNSSSYCVFTIQSNNEQGNNSIQLQNVQCSAQ